jgi:hypothetical protein
LRRFELCKIDLTGEAETGVVKERDLGENANDFEIETGTRL